jgi:ankyrin repeat protein
LLAQGKGASVNEKTRTGYTAVMFAAGNGHKGIVEYLEVRGLENEGTPKCVQERARDTVRL